jgi:hypothetical protein
MRPFSSMTYAMRFAYSSFGESAAPYAMPILRSVSQSSGKGKSNFSANLALSAALSKLAPRMVVFFFSYSPMRSRNPEPSAVQPGVSAFG